VSKSAIKFDCVLLCDDVRQEYSLKTILIGIYSGPILFNELPKTINLSAWLHGSATISGDYALELQYRFTRNEDNTAQDKKPTILAIVKAKKDKEFALALVGVPIEFESPGELSLYCRVDGGRWRKR